MPSLDTSARWFRRVRLAVWGCQLAVVLWASLGLRIDVRLSWVLSIIGVAALADVGSRLWPNLSQRQVLALMLTDTALHTALFALTGGPFNPFTILYLVDVVLAALLLSRARQWVVLAAQLLGFGALFAVERLAPATWQLPNHQQLMRLHLTGMWVAFVIAAAFIVYFVQRLLQALDETRRRSVQHEKLAALTTLAAGAAHELATPLGTIAIAAQEMARALASLDVPPTVRDDVLLIRQQVERCRAILEGLSARSGAVAGEASSTFVVHPWLEESLRGLDRSRLQLHSDEGLTLTGPRAALAQALRNLVKNALEASPSAVLVEARQRGGTLELAVTDRGPGVDDATLARLGEPFFTTKPAGRGMGLGVFLARSLASQLGGTLSYRSAPGQGTVATLTLKEVT